MQHLHDIENVATHFLTIKVPFCFLLLVVQRFIIEALSSEVQSAGETSLHPLHIWCQ